jgi:hypothetical protein
MPTSEANLLVQGGSAEDIDVLFDEFLKIQFQRDISQIRSANIVEIIASQENFCG